LSLGTAKDGRELTLAIRGMNALIAGDPRSGKSWVAGLMCEQLILQGYSLCIIDPEGDYRSLETLPGVVVFGGEDPPPELPDLARVLRHPDMSVVIDLSHAPYPEKISYMKSLLPLLSSIRKKTGLPHRIVIDEAHYFLHEPNISALVDLSLGAYTFITYHLADLEVSVRNVIEYILVKCTTDAREIETLTGMLNVRGNCKSMIPDLSSLLIDEAILLPRINELDGECSKFKLFPRLTPHVRHKMKYLDLQLLTEQGFWFTDRGKLIDSPARTLSSFLNLLEIVSPDVLAAHAHHGDFSRWIANVFHDHSLAADIRNVEQRFRVGHVHDLTTSISKLVQDRYELSPGS
jgi:hypothetical protein